MTVETQQPVDLIVTNFRDELRARFERVTTKFARGSVVHPTTPRQTEPSLTHETNLEKIAPYLRSSTSPNTRH
ncbi:hypothetical protein A2Z22_00495 [Candidatus Woesebacteria bacterium RBG_16_34_12]|uniref:Uncharacterized protein n=1 Tax=Candidatus Woesebacteria bacterium RBG_16_34_12 TaxID=1802480 RepID=A0A1F7X908_9BACT|nr:MAG: hypothetical protein A2Z22_00495 [Candidatus Woesebacteria bacterium RBG_16_34_12]